MPGPDDFGYNLLPPDPGLLSPDLALDAALAPVEVLGTTPPRPLGRGWSYDFLAGRFVRHGNSPAEVYDTDHLRIWIEKTLRTAKYAHPIYGPEYGMAEPFRLIGQPFDAALVGQYQQDVVTALTVHDRIAAVDSFSFYQDPLDDALYVSFVVTLDDHDSTSMQITSVPIKPFAWTPR